MKLTFILFTFFINFFHPLYIKAEGIIDSSNEQKNNSLKESLLKNDSENKKIHIVQIGDTITSISKSYGITKELIIKLNNLKDENYIYVGQNLIISDSNKNLINKESESNQDKDSYHIVKKGENLTEISNKYGLKLDNLLEINNLNTPDSIKEGSKIFLRKNKTNNKETSNLKGEKINQFLNVDKKTYGPLTIQQNEFKEVSGRKILNVLNQSNKKLIISIKCETKDIDVRIPGRKWRGWMPAKEEFEKDLIKDLCRKF